VSICTAVYVIAQTSILGAILLTDILAARLRAKSAWAVNAFPSSSRPFSVRGFGQGFSSGRTRCAHRFRSKVLHQFQERPNGQHSSRALFSEKRTAWISMLDER
jgi:hypothetical protein